MEENGEIFFNSGVALDDSFSTISLNDKNHSASEEEETGDASPFPQRAQISQPANSNSHKSCVEVKPASNHSHKNCVEVKPAEDDLFANATSDFTSMISPVQQAPTRQVNPPVALFRQEPLAPVNPSARQEPLAVARQPPVLPVSQQHLTVKSKPQIIEDEDDIFGASASAPSPFSELVVGARGQTSSLGIGPRGQASELGIGARGQTSELVVGAEQAYNHKVSQQPQLQSINSNLHPIVTQLQQPVARVPITPIPQVATPTPPPHQPILHQQGNGHLMSRPIVTPQVPQQQQHANVNSMGARTTPVSYELLDGTLSGAQVQENHQTVKPNTQLSNSYAPMQNQIFVQQPVFFNPALTAQQRQMGSINTMNPVSAPSQQQQQQCTRTPSAFEQVSQGYEQPTNNLYKQPSPQLFQNQGYSVQPQTPFLQQHDKYGQQGGFYSQIDNISSTGVQVDMNIRQQQIYNIGSPMARPIVAFGFGGKMAVLFPQRQQKLNVLDQSVNNLPFLERVPVKLFDLSSVLSQTQYAAGLQQFPGPLNAQTNKQDIAKFIDQVIYHYQNDTYSGIANPRILAMTLLWKLLRIILANDSLNESALNKTVLEIKSMLLEHKKDNGSWLNNSQHQYQQHQQYLGSNVDAPSQQDLFQLEKLLMDGNIEDATQFAMQARLWAHAMLLSVMIDKITYQKVVTAFAQSSFPDGSPLRTLYMMFADRGDLLFHASAVSMDQHGNTFTSHSRQQQQSQQQQISKLCDNWEENLCMVITNRTATSGKVIEKLGDSLNKEQGVEAAHLCYLIGNYCCQLDFSQRLSLVGGDYRRDKRVTASAIQRTEIYEFCKQKLSPQPYLMPQLATFKLVYAFWLAEIGFTTRAMQYAEYLSSVYQQTKNIANYSAHFIYQLQVLKHRIQEAQKWNIGEKKGSSLSSGSASGGVTGWIASGLTRIIHGAAADDDALSSVAQEQQALPSGKPIMQKQQPQPQPPQQVAPSPSQPLSVQTSQQQTVTEPKKNWWTGWFSFGGVKSRKEANIGQENKFEWNEKLKRWIPRGANPADFAEEEAPPPPEMLATTINEMNYDHTQSSFRGPNLHISSRYVAVGFGADSGKAIQKTPTTPSGSMTSSLLFGVNNVPVASQPSSFFVPSSPTSAQPGNEQQQQEEHGASSFQHPPFVNNSNWDRSFEQMHHPPAQIHQQPSVPMTIGMHPPAPQQQPYFYQPDKQE